ncbi:hypothetical protein [Niabella sp.]|uniref:hypothetical protein n=1 Tax=Niabella sp. TaxID=1962976 RepID=UPI0026161A3A|nr:hypothetical protein [Niabella sp.]
MRINQQLKSVYEDYLAELKRLPKEQTGKFSYPLLMKAFPSYEKVKHKILFVGKETYGWGGTMNKSQNLTVEKLMKDYEAFEFAKNYPGRNSPFWRFLRVCHNKLNGEDFPDGFLWTNISKCDNNGTSPEFKLQKLNDKGFEMILDEIQITKPEIVIFITGWNYEYQFQRVFSGLEYKTLEENYLYQCIHPALPKHSYMTMHPNGLQFRKKFDTTLNQIIDKIRQ